MTPGPGFTAHGAGLTWIAPDPAFMRRASHAVAIGGRVWLVDVVDAPGLDDAVAALGTVRAVVQLLDRHARDCASVAARLGVPHLRVPDEIGGAFQVLPVVRFPGWREAALWAPEERILVVADALGSAGYFLAPGEPLAVHPLLRLTPPAALRGLAPEHLLTGHGRGLHGPQAATALEDALRTSRRRVPAWLAGLPGARGRGRPDADPPSSGPDRR